jgi:hypothetical protein
VCNASPNLESEEIVLGKLKTGFAEKGVLPRFSWLTFPNFQAQCSTEQQNPNSIALKVAKASCRRLDRLNPAFQSVGCSIADRRRKPCQVSSDSSLQHLTWFFWQLRGNTLN